MCFTAQPDITMGGLEDFEKLYGDLVEQFPEDERYPHGDFIRLLNSGRYQLMLYRPVPGEEAAGYALVYIPPEGGVAWLDFLAVRKQYQSQGYGHKLFRAVCESCFSAFDGVIFAVEPVSAENPELVHMQERRIRFYEHLGARRLHAEFLLPGGGGSFPLYLYYRAKNDGAVLTRSAQISAIRHMYADFYPRLDCGEALLGQFEGTVRDECFTN